MLFLLCNLCDECAVEVRGTWDWKKGVSFKIAVCGITFLGLDLTVLKQLLYTLFRKEEEKPELKYFVLQANPLFGNRSLFQMVSNSDVIREVVPAVAGPVKVGVDRGLTYF